MYFMIVNEMSSIFCWNRLRMLRGINDDEEGRRRGGEPTRTYFSRAVRRSRTLSLMSAMLAVAYWPTKYRPPAIPAVRANFVRRSYR